MSTTLPSSVYHLPIVSLLPRIEELLSLHNRLIIEAPPGSGKTTIVPLSLLHSDWRSGKKILVIQPRRLAARNVALRMAELLTQEVGTQVGYRMRLETKVSRSTEVEVLTEGVLLKMLLKDSELNDVAAIIFDEFHERSALSEIMVSMVHEVADSIRPDLKIILMSATMGELPQKHFSEYQRIVCEVAPHPVTLHYRHIPSRARLEDEAASLIASVLDQHEEGNLLVFMPGSGEIRRTIRSLEERISPVKRSHIEILPLYGELSYSEQNYALLPSKEKRRIIVATNIAETSLTIPGVKIVIDSGYQKTLRIDPHTMINSLVRERISLDAAVQRCGRAAREGHGICYRMWSEEEHKTLRQVREPEVLRVDVSDFILAVLSWGAPDYESFPWITKPPLHAASSAMRVLQLLGAVAPDGKLTKKGKSYGEFGADLRLSALAVSARIFRLERLGALLISFLEEHGAKLYNSGESSDITHHIEGLIEPSSNKSALRKGTLRHFSVEEWEERIRRTHVIEYLSSPSNLPEQIGVLLASAFPDQIALRRKNSEIRYQLASGIGASLLSHDPLQKHNSLVVCTLSSKDNRENADATIVLAAPLSLTTVRSYLPHLCTKSTSSEFDEERGTLTVVTRESIGVAVVSETPVNHPSEEEKRSALLQFLATDRGFRRLPFHARTQSFLSRITWAKYKGGLVDLPEFNQAVLQREIHTWLAPFIPPSVQLCDISEEVLLKALEAALPWELNKKLGTFAPATITLPTGKERPLTYSETNSPILEATVQELLGWKATPFVGLTMVPITIEILSPARRPIQRTNDLNNFWSGSYSAVRKEYRGRYPKHAWPEDPLDFDRTKPR